MSHWYAVWYHKLILLILLTMLIMLIANIADRHVAPADIAA
jgi:hypothetical protein